MQAPIRAWCGSEPVTESFRLANVLHVRFAHYRISSTGTLQERTISVVVDPITRLRMRLWP